MVNYPPHMREVRRKSKEMILEILAKDSSTIKEFYKSIKKTHTKICDEEIKCTCGKNNGTSPEWKHQVGWALEDLKYRGKITYDKKTKLYSII